ncbi:hypothetical protein CEXT_760911 [Caerostris extrusa]|uniref:Uncharacterized protein n=1 Tax=Caerostris extrusa TaxID=172846 RepID=A0AAV4XLZ7_CAEEX|nr:hypothetical protein CEXT_760911 [Caerostris extrusa]
MRIQFQECSRWSHLPSRPVVVQVHEGPLVPFDLPGVHELPAHLHAVSDVRAAAAPLPATLGSSRPSLLVSQPHCHRLPLLQACVMAYVTPADVTAYVYDASRLPGRNGI